MFGSDTLFFMGVVVYYIIKVNSGIKGSVRGQLEIFDGFPNIAF